MNMNEAELRAEVERLTAANHRLSTHLIGMSDTLQASAREIAAKAWEEGRASVALDFLKPMDETGIRESTPNPYRQAEDAA
ncbi:hypothetical protein LJ753_16715 [Arthrobacter sp. zg-Y20]|uniref:hypothetical protein n=1 Tax=unclassified Arthrobacter TaxID=235627 RepID=UPI001D158236|nr:MULTISPECIES: hypothetical protein [unclassified Arthrobacter]MCC3277508.1 hypothetical protein [Arthrobacter sp. zg-Y20]MDK1317668.1 hypothetical protein [Arthrobacter sp. zg.Y20]WIB07072.1 hypothetical protein QNO06_04910 [Arthrobacter sp. zg-Y20]